MQEKWANTIRHAFLKTMQYVTFIHQTHTHCFILVGKKYLLCALQFNSFTAIYIIYVFFSILFVHNALEMHCIHYSYSCCGNYYNDAKYRSWFFSPPKWLLLYILNCCWARIPMQLYRVWTLHYCIQARTWTHAHKYPRLHTYICKGEWQIRMYFWVEASPFPANIKCIKWKSKSIIRVKAGSN